MQDPQQHADVRTSVGPQQQGQRGSLTLRQLSSKKGNTEILLLEVSRAWDKYYSESLLRFDGIMINSQVNNAKANACLEAMIAATSAQYWACRVCSDFDTALLNPQICSFACAQGVPKLKLAAKCQAYPQWWTNCSWDHFVPAASKQDNYSLLI